jgi:fluoroacetyl-CoA thioesterase
LALRLVPEMSDEPWGWTEVATPRNQLGRMLLDLSKLSVGLKGSADLLVGADHTAPKVGSGRIPVLATPVMINVIEAAALAAVEDLLPAGHQSLGIHLDIRHFAATPVGMRVRATAELTAIELRTLSFRVEARDEVELIGEGMHQRVVVNVARFDARVQRKSRLPP